MRTTHRQRPSPPVKRISASEADDPCNASSRAVNLGAKPLPRPAKKKKRTQHDWDRIHAVPKKQHEALDRGDLDKEKGEADRKEIQSDSPSRESSGRD